MRKKIGVVEGIKNLKLKEMIKIWKDGKEIEWGNELIMKK